MQVSSRKCTENVKKRRCIGNASFETKQNVIYFAFFRLRLSSASSA